MSQVPIKTIEISNPFFEGTNRVYVIIGDPITLIDCGIASGKAFHALVNGLRENGLSPNDIGRVVLTHKHIDHIGNGWRIQRASGAEVLVHETEVESVTDVDPEGKQFGTVVNERLNEWDVPVNALPASSSKVMRWNIEAAKAEDLVDGQLLPIGNSQLEVIHTPGHTIGSICLRYDQFLFSGDHLLPDISPNIGGGDLRHRGLLREYLESSTRIRALASDDMMVMPGHGDAFSELAHKCDEMIDHHHARLERVLRILKRGGPQTVYQIASQLFGDMEDFHVVLGCGEAHSHLEFLEEDNHVACENGMYRLVR